ncbi:MAG: alpha/beta fold hydrolase [Bacteroidota bacterium]
MPYLDHPSNFKVPFYQLNGHLQTIFPSLFREVKVSYKRERIELSDGDFLDLDWINNGSKKLLVQTHGLEGNSDRIYIRGMGEYFSQREWDVLAWNCRSCSGEMNRTFKLYHHGDTHDITEVIDYVNQTRKYEEIVLIGFSMGGSINTKYLGVKGETVPSNIKASVSFSTPCDLKASSETLDRRSNFIYKNKFLKRLKLKITHKANQFPGNLDLELFDRIKKWRDFDEFFSAPLSGYANADEFYHYSSAKNYLHSIKIPTLLINAANDPILTPACHPIEEARKHPYVYVEVPKIGGHVGFAWKGKPYSWAEWRAYDFLENLN